MNSRAQSALEYLMTYGWALTVIALVVGLIVVILTSVTTGGVTCATNSTNFNLQEYSVAALDGNGNARFVIQNASGKSVSGVKATSNTDFNRDYNSLAGTFTKGQNLIIRVDGPPSAGTFTNGVVDIEFDWANTQDVNFKILCSGNL